MTVLVAGQLVADRYELLSRIAVGGMGEVWEAADTRLGRSVAVKILRPDLSGDDEFRHRFRIEARTVASLDHPGIAHVHDYGEEVEPDGRRTAYLVMELVRGEPLSTIVARGPVEPDETLRIVEQAAWALHAAHERGFVHRDVKPGNILVADDGRVKLTDFGIAKAANAAPVTRSGMVMGTAHYIAPEQATGGEAGPTGDVYSLGIVSYECLAGHRPFRGESAVDVAAMQVRDAPPPLPASIPANVRDLIDAVLVKDPAQRYSTGREFAEAVAAVRRGEPAPLPAQLGGDTPAPVRRKRRWGRSETEQPMRRGSARDSAGEDGRAPAVETPRSPAVGSAIAGVGQAGREDGTRDRRTATGREDGSPGTRTATGREDGSPGTRTATGPEDGAGGRAATGRAPAGLRTPAPQPPTPNVSAGTSPPATPVPLGTPPAPPGRTYVSGQPPRPPLDPGSGAYRSVPDPGTRHRAVDSPPGGHRSPVEPPAGNHRPPVDSPSGSHRSPVDSPSGSHRSPIDSPSGSHRPRLDGPTGERPRHGDIPSTAIPRPYVDPPAPAEHRAPRTPPPGRPRTDPSRTPAAHRPPARPTRGVPLGHADGAGSGRLLIVLFVLLTLAAVVVGYLVFVRGLGSAGGALGQEADITPNHTVVAARPGSVAGRTGVTAGQTADGGSRTTAYVVGGVR